MAEVESASAVDAWLMARGLELFPFQRETIAAYLAGESGSCTARPDREKPLRRGSAH